MFCEMFLSIWLHDEYGTPNTPDTCNPDSQLQLITNTKHIPTPESCILVFLASERKKQIGYKHMHERSPTPESRYPRTLPHGQGQVVAVR